MTLNEFLDRLDGGRQVEVDHIGRELRTIKPRLPQYLEIISN